MRAIVVYESMYGNTRQVAEAIAHGLGASGTARVVSVADVAEDDVARCDLLVVGGPTHVHGMSRAATRHSAADVASATGSLSLDPNSAAGVRGWLATVKPSGHGQKAAAFDTRTKGPSLLTGRASKGISARLQGAGFDVVAGPESFVVSSEPVVSPEELERARIWGQSLAGKLTGN